MHFMLSTQIEKEKKVYERSPQIGRLLSREHSEETPPTRSRMKSKSKCIATLIPMAGKDNKIAPILEMLEKMQTRMDESDKRIDVMVAILQNCNKESHGKDNDDKKDGENRDENLETLKRGEDEEKNAPPMDLRVYKTITERILYV